MPSGRGGVGLIISSCNPFPHGFPYLLNAYDDKFIPYLREAVQVVHSYDVPIVAQLTVMHELAQQLEERGVYRLFYRGLC